MRRLLLKAKKQQKMRQAGLQAIEKEKMRQLGLQAIQQAQQLSDMYTTSSEDGMDD